MTFPERIVVWFAHVVCAFRGHDLRSWSIVDPDDYLPTGDLLVICTRCGEMFS